MSKVDKENQKNGVPQKIETENLVEVRDLKEYFPTKQGFKTIPLKAVDGVSFSIKAG